MKRNPTKLLFIGYCLVLLWVILLKTAVSLEDLRFLVRDRAINLVPLDYDVPIGIPQMREATLNMLMFIPMGIYLKMFGVSLKKTILYGFCISLSFEITQYVLAIGVADITDLLTNTLGTAMGACFYALLRKLLRDQQKTDRTINTVAMAVLVAVCVILLLMLIN